MSITDDSDVPEQKSKNKSSQDDNEEDKNSDDLFEFM